jgi:pyruvate-formate lyase-activating enzyme
MGGLIQPKLEDIGFYTLTDYRAKNVSSTSPLQRCELILTSRCNFNCPYCRGMLDADQGDISKDDAIKIIDLWTSHNLRNIRLSGGEPTLWPYLYDVVAHANSCGINRIALSTNGSACPKIYMDLIEAGVNDFSISLDSCCSDICNKMTGTQDMWDKIISNIKLLSGYTYVSVGVVLTNNNAHDINNIVKFASDLGVSDIRIIPAAQTGKTLSGINIDSTYLDHHPILKYRSTNFANGGNVRGLSPTDSQKCPLVLDDMAVLNGYHYPCIIYMREHGHPIGPVGDSMDLIRSQRLEWYKGHNCSNDMICKTNCLDVCVDYNNRVRYFQSLDSR